MFTYARSQSKGRASLVDLGAANSQQNPSASEAARNWDTAANVATGIAAAATIAAERIVKMPGPQAKGTAAAAAGIAVAAALAEKIARQKADEARQQAAKEQAAREQAAREQAAREAEAQKDREWQMAMDRVGKDHDREKGRREAERMDRADRLSRTC